MRLERFEALMLDARWWDNPTLIEAPIALIVAIFFAVFYVADWLATGRSFNLRAFIAVCVGGTAAVCLFFSIF